MFSITDAGKGMRMMRVEGKKFYRNTAAILVERTDGPLPGVETIEACEALCAAIPRCLGATWVEATRLCHTMFKNQHALQVSFLT